jgi:multidrug transporter EmrE-like cation transporter
MLLAQWLITILVGIIAAINIVVIKQYTVKKGAWLVVVILTTILTTFCYIKLFEKVNVSVGYAVAKAITIILVVLAGVILFRDESSWTTWVGLLILIIGITIITI